MSSPYAPVLIIIGSFLIICTSAGLYAHKKGQSGFGVFFLLSSTTGLLLHILDEQQYNPYFLIGWVGILISSLGAIYAQAKNKNKWKYVLPGLLPLLYGAFNDTIKLLG